MSFRLTMATLDDLWARFTLSEEEVQGADVPSSKEVSVHRLAGKFLTKRIVNAEAVARTFKPLWKPNGGLKIRDMGRNVLVFEFDDALDLERVLEFEPWSYDKSLVIFQKTESVESAPSLEFSVISFWVQLHNVPETSLNQETGEVVGNTIGTTIRVADPEDDGEGREFLRIRVAMNITKPLPRCCKLRSEGKHIGWALLKFERLPNFCYWCGRVDHVEKDCETWLKNREKYGKEDQQFGDWMRAEQYKSSRKSVVVIAGNARGSPKWKKGPPMPKDNTTNPGAESSNLQTNLSESVMETEPPVEFVVATHSSLTACDVQKKNHENPLQQDYVSEAHLDLRQNEGAASRNKGEPVIQRARTPMQDLTNLQINLPDNTTLRTWQKIAREFTPQQENVNNPSSIDRRPLLELDELQPIKKKCRQTNEVIMQENYKADAGCQLRRGQ